MKLILSAIMLLPIGIFGFSASNRQPLLQARTQTPVIQFDCSRTHDNSPHHSLSTSGWWTPLAIAGLLVLAPPAWADEEVAPAPKPATEITACRKNPTGTTNCVSTRNVKQLDLYAPPWTFETSPEEAAARIKGVVASDPNLELLREQDNLYFQIKATRSSIFTDNVEVLINPSDKVVTFRAEQDGEPSVSDFGAIRKELDSIRQKSKFGVMGQGLGAADTMPSQNGPIGQLKAFYGLQSGRGYEDVFEED
jgi:uncharacterized protein (DUF1499 family)